MRFVFLNVQDWVRVVHGLYSGLRIAQQSRNACLNDVAVVSSGSIMARVFMRRHRVVFAHREVMTNSRATASERTMLIAMASGFW